MKNIWIRIGVCLLALLLLPLPVRAAEETAGTVSVSYVEPMYDDGSRVRTVHAQMPPRELLAPADATDVSGAGKAMREALLQHESVFTVLVGVDGQLSYEGANQLFEDVYYAAVAHDGTPKGGDFIRFGGCSWEGEGAYWEEGGRSYCRMVYAISYYTTAQQERELDAQVAALLEELDLWQESEYGKVLGIYNYLCENITYDFDNLYNDSYKLKYTAYAALVNKKAVCQGYATLFYRLALELGLDARVIPGYGAGGLHAWNIVRIGNCYYNLDSTWDAGVDSYRYFLRTPTTFGDHIREPEYATAAFAAQYPMATEDHPGEEEKPEAVKGDFTGDAQVNNDDVIFLLWHTLFGDEYPVTGGDVNGDRLLNNDDVIYLLWHTLFGAGEYPLR